jgi:DNA-binding XRE family transcriptional regulator
MNKEDNKMLCKEFFTHINDLVMFRQEFCTQQEMAQYLNTTRQTILNFETCKTFNFLLLYSYAAMFGKQIIIT